MTQSETSNAALKRELDALRAEKAELEQVLDALDKSQAVIEFELDGTIIDANDNFLAAMGYSRDEIVGQHHRLFADPEYAKSPEYRAFWERLGSGVFDAGEYKRFAKGGREIWIQASYNPVFDEDGKQYKVVKYATDITERKLAEADARGKLEAIGKSQAVIEFEPNGTILHANDNFLAATGYTLKEVVGQHHRMFMDPKEAASPEYRAFWSRLAEGVYDAGEYRRFGKHGKEIWIQASYNPILDADGRPFKVVKFATDITDAKLQSAYYEGQLEAIGKLQAVIEFELDGTIINANENFLKTLGYSLEEIKGKHHRMFAEPSYASSPEYEAFWAKLRRGQYDAGEYKRIGKGGREVWIDASYNPILDMNGKPFKVVKYASDITAQKGAQVQIARLIEAAADGDLSQRIDAEGYTGFIRDLSDGMNDLIEAVAAPIQATVAVVEALAEGDLTTTMEGEYSGEFAALRDAVNATVKNLERMVGDILSASESIAHGSREISEGNVNLSQRTEEQASSLEETAASMAELTETVKQSAENATQASELSDSARTQAEQGGEVVELAITAMENINKSSNQIADIIGVIDEIAFQTNLLALNAAVEAARAGEHGRGFAVVASEVRNLAQRSADSAKEIKGLIKDSVARVAEGSDLVNKSGARLRDIVSAVKKVTDIVGEIAHAANEQALGIDQVNTAVAQMDDVTQQNAALVEEAAAASESLDEQAAALKKRMEFFRVNGGASTSYADDADAAPTPGQERRRPGSVGSPLRPGVGKVSPAAGKPSRAAAAGGDSWESF